MGLSCETSSARRHAIFSGVDELEYAPRPAAGPAVFYSRFGEKRGARRNKFDLVLKKEA